MKPTLTLPGSRHSAAHGRLGAIGIVVGCDHHGRVEQRVAVPADDHIEPGNVLGDQLVAVDLTP